MPEQQAQELALMFVDIPTVAAIRDMEGEIIAREFIDSCLSLLSKVREKWDGTQVRTVGGTLLCSFTSAEKAVRASCEMQRAVAEAEFRTLTRATLRMGLHFGTVQMRNKSCTGEVVTTTARMVTIAKPGQIVATGTVMDNLPEECARWGGIIPGVEAMEKRLGVRLCEICWKQHLASATSTTGTAPSEPETAQKPKGQLEDNRRKKTDTFQKESSDSTTPDWRAASRNNEEIGDMQQKLAQQKMQKTEVLDLDATTMLENAVPDTTRLCIIWQGKVMVVDAKNVVLTIGRDEDNDVATKVSTASRRHGEVRYRDGEFYLIDRSANGTFVYDETGQELYVEATECKLGLSGAISPGCPQNAPDCEPLLFWQQNK